MSRGGSGPTLVERTRAGEIVAPDKRLAKNYGAKLAEYIRDQFSALLIYDEVSAEIDNDGFLHIHYHDPRDNCPHFPTELFERLNLVGHASSGMNPKPDCIGGWSLGGNGYDIVSITPKLIENCIAMQASKELGPALKTIAGKLSGTAKAELEKIARNEAAMKVIGVSVEKWQGRNVA